MKRITALAVFVLASCVAVYLESTFHVTRNAYWLFHFKFGVFFPFFFYGLGWKARHAFTMVLLWSVTNEVSDAFEYGFFQISHFSSDLLGLALTISAYLVAKKYAGRARPGPRVS